MGLTADEKDVTIAHLAVQLTVVAQRAEDAEERVRQLEAELATLTGKGETPDAPPVL